jgi:hypothetical protein
MPTPVTAGPVDWAQSRMISDLGMIDWSESGRSGANVHGALMAPMERPEQGTLPSEHPTHVRGIECG